MFLSVLYVMMENIIFILLHILAFTVMIKSTQTCKHYAIPCSSDKDPSFQIIHKSLLDDKGILWMSSWRVGLIEFDPHTEKIKEWLYNKNDSISCSALYKSL